MATSFFTQASWQGAKRETSRIASCGKCGLFRQCVTPKMPPTGRGDRKVLFVAEAPGENEDRKGVQLIGKAGQKLRQILRELDCQLDDCWKDNACRCRPPHNKIEPIYIESCRPNLLRTIRELKPSVIVLLGGSAVRSLIPAEREADVGAIARWVGWRIPSHEHQAWICPTYHPSYLLRVNSPVLDRIFKEHLRRALLKEGKPIKSEPLDVLKSKVECIQDPKSALLRVQDLGKRSGVLAFDYESNRLKPDHHKSRIYACSFCLEGEDTFSVLVTDELLPAISEVLRRKQLRKVASNLKNEERWTRAIMKHPVAGWYWDTMLASHVLDNRTGITGLKFQAFVNFGIADYNRVVERYFEQVDREGFNRIEDCPKEELLQYNALDSLLEYRLAMVQRKQMGLT